MVKIKICGITNEKEIAYLNLLKPDYAGFVFAESKRKINKCNAKMLVSKLDSNIKSVGVFRNQSILEIIEVLNSVKLDVIQLHGNEDAEFIKNIRKQFGHNIEIWKALSISNIYNLKNFIHLSYEYKDEYGKNISSKLIDKYLIDGQVPGSGESYSLNLLKKYINENKISADYFLAGGITPENVKDKVLEIDPFGIDVSSGVETINKNGNRMKSYEKIKNLKCQLMN